ncbi:hypothetical protein [Desmospora profundinema]|uniref:Uncharacterized protein n=1 Tax=Desmospora profundinema TaxID=1571184 RepID=A0ABU1IUC8_9BACL|nr:hypothetical protein [Desmospora profundinema]MDR6227365.1 hypothetical protein [Desmospora profundinema]
MVMYLGGYFIIEKKDIISASNCVCDTYPDEWAYSWAGYDRELLSDIEEKTQKSRRELVLLRKWVEKKFDSEQIGWPNVFYSLKLAIDFQSEFLKNIDTRIIGIGTTLDHLKNILEENKSDDDVDPGGVYHTLAKQIEVDMRGRIAGYDILGYEGGFFHSFMCNGLKDEYEKMGIFLNKYHLLPTFQKAELAAQATSGREDLELFSYQPWEIRLYDNANI